MTQQQRAMGDEFKIVEQWIEDWHCAVFYSKPGPNVFNVRWWVVDNLKDGTRFHWTFNPLSREPKGVYPRLLVKEQGGPIEFEMGEVK